MTTFARLRGRAARTRDALSSSSVVPGERRRRRIERLNSRVADLEQEVQELRRLSHRLAELTDLVQELLVAAASRDDARVRELLERYDPGR